MFLTLIYSVNIFALVPLEGVIYGDVKNILQFDPLRDIYSDSAVTEGELLSDKERAKLEVYNGLYRQGANMKFRCEQKSPIRYNSTWEEETAKRSVVGTLQYIGLDLSMRAIIEYSKQLEYSTAEFNNLVNNLIKNTCSQNLTVYSHKLLLNNFHHLYKNGTNFNIPSIIKSPYFSEVIRAKTNSRAAKENEFNMAIKNFRAFCSWGGDTDNYRMLTPYLNNPFIMHYVYNNLIGKKVKWDNNKKIITQIDDKNAVRVACQDLICRNSDIINFKRKFPRMVGSTDLMVDLNNLYCSHFSQITYVYKEQNPAVKEWIKKQTIEEPYLESMNMVSLLTGVPDLMYTAEKYNDLVKLLRENIDHRWNKWADEKNKQFVTDLLYEESLNVDLVPMAKSSEIYKGNFQIVFDYTMGEIDRVLDVVDKISSKFNLAFPKSYLRWLRDEYIKKNNKSDFKAVESLRGKVKTYVKIQLETKKELFLIPMWNEKMSDIITDELIEQLVTYKGKYFKDFSHEKVNIPVKFRYGLFALKYFNQRFKAKYRSKALTFNK